MVNLQLNWPANVAMRRRKVSEKKCNSSYYLFIYLFIYLFTYLFAYLVSEPAFTVAPVERKLALMGLTDQVVSWRMRTNPRMAEFILMKMKLSLITANPASTCYG